MEKIQILFAEQKFNCEESSVSGERRKTQGGHDHPNRPYLKIRNTPSIPFFENSRKIWKLSFDLSGLPTFSESGSRRHFRFESGEKAPQGQLL